MPWHAGPTSTGFPHYDQGTTPASPSAGEFWWDRNIHVLKRYNGTSWDWVGLDDLANVDASGKADSNILEWDTAPDPDAWVAAVKPSGGSGSAGVSRARVVQSSNQSIPNATFTALQFGGSDDFDTDAIHDPATNNSRLTVPATGGWLFGVTCEISGLASGRSIILAHAINGTQQNDWVRDLTGATSDPTQHGTWLRSLSSGDYVEFNVFHDHGSSRNTAASRTRAWIVRMW